VESHAGKRRMERGMEKRKENELLEYEKKKKKE
jgi:hypothetical protein